MRSKGKSEKQLGRLSNLQRVSLLEFNKSVIKLESNRLVGVTGEKMKNEVTAYGIFKIGAMLAATAITTLKPSAGLKLKSVSVVRRLCLGAGLFGRTSNPLTR